MAYGRRASFEAVREVAFGGVGAAYAALGAATTDYARIIAINNTTNQDVYISFDGTTNHLRVASGSAKVFDLTTNEVQTEGLFLSNRTTFYQRHTGVAPTAGNVWIEVLYGAGGF